MLRSKCKTYESGLYRPKNALTLIKYLEVLIYKKEDCKLWS